ncbi:MAG: nickel-dependent lactate racemase [Candidatus Bathyarchaeia archaeon]
MSVKIQLPYGKEKVFAELPTHRLVFVVKPKDFPGVEDDEEEIRRAFRNPVGTPRISELVRPGQRVVIVADDLTRVTPCRKIIPIILDELNAAGVKDENIKLIIGLGTHRPMTRNEIVHRFGKQVVDRIEVMNHTPFDKGNLAYLGRLASGIPLWVNKEFLEGDVKIVVGNVVPHCFGGFSAGAKGVLPGICGEETTGMLHLTGARITVDRLIGRVENPLRRDMEEAARIVGLDMIVNTVLTRERRIAGVFVGDFVKAHREAVKIVEKIYIEEVPKEADIVIASSYPADIEYYQGIKGVFASYRAVKKGGTIILLTPCPEGIAQTHPAIAKYASLPSKEIDRIAKEEKIEDPCGVACAMVHAQQREKAHLIFVSEGLTREMCNSLGVEKAESLDEALELALKRHGKEATIGVITESDILALVRE